MDLFLKIAITFTLTLCMKIICSETDVIEVITLDTCNGDVFKPTCPNSRDTLLMLSASYGRMEIGKCINKKEVTGMMGQDPTYFGCSSDVLRFLHDKCSLKQTCDIRIPNDHLDTTEPCFPGLKLYLHTEYRCIKVIDQEQNCRLQVHSTPQYLTTTTIFKLSSCGRKNNPWLFEAQRGQKIKLILETIKSDISPGMTCEEEIGLVFDKSYGSMKNATLCLNGFVGTPSVLDINQRIRKQKNTFLSTGSIVEVMFNEDFIKSREKSSSTLMILMKIESDGCLDIIPPEDAWLKRTNDEIVIGCYSSKQTWYLRCENKKWTGTIGNCSLANKHLILDGEDSVSKMEHTNEINEEQQIILFVAICALGVVICLVIVCVGAICIKRYSWKSPSTVIYDKQPTFYQTGQYSVNHQMLLDNQSKSLSNHQEPTNCDLIIDQQINEKSEENKYFILEDNCG